MKQTVELNSKTLIEIDTDKMVKVESSNVLSIGMTHVINKQHGDESSSICLLVTFKKNPSLYYIYYNRRFNQETFNAWLSCESQGKFLRSEIIGSDPITYKVEINEP